MREGQVVSDRGRVQSGRAISHPHRAVACLHLRTARVEGKGGGGLRGRAGEAPCYDGCGVSVIQSGDGLGDRGVRVREEQKGGAGSLPWRDLTPHWHPIACKHERSEGGVDGE